ncbi:exodeoxyribonuclease VII large subunit [Aliidiomarina celeris]|uniref:exodeoxyribonuclease VII large subunit n=1 Tax=Aliidiomarina celeris TaxID=2249428 RepID=UPI000DEBE5CB|nr:exodeoxyribonuclease VII large subunit [Aliidiomarina celeris]
MELKKDIYTVSRLNKEVRELIERQWASVWLVGEISNLSKPGSGHWYFTLKDDQAQISCAMFRGNNQYVRTTVSSGMQVMIRARVSLYEPRGNYQLIVEQLEPAGEGLLQQRFEQLKQQLAHEGLFAVERKRALPAVRTLGVITSPTGAALRDVLAVLQRRDPSLKVIIYPAQVQGTEAPGQLRQALASAIRRNEVDALLLTRGGGSLEDLWAFNDEMLARELANCPIPTLSAVGHEVDFTITDFIADVRAATPSAAAELVSHDQSVHLRHLQQLKERGWRAWQSLMQRHSTHLNHMQARLSSLSPRQRIERQAQQLDELDARVQRAVQQRFRAAQQQLVSLQHRLNQQHPERELPLLKAALEQREQRLLSSMSRLMNVRVKHFQALQQSLHIVSPLNTLARGYTLSFNTKGEIVRSANQLKVGDALHTRFGEGQVVSEIKSIKS